jgi:hypothetical protein
VAGGLAGGRSNRDRVERAHAVLGELGYALELKRTLSGWDAVVYPMDNASAIGELVAHAVTQVEAAELAVAYIQSRVLHRAPL